MSLMYVPFVKQALSSNGWMLVMNFSPTINADVAADVDSSGNVYFSGHQVQGAGNSDLFYAKCNSAGTVQWVKSFGTTSRDAIYTGNAMAVDSSNNIYFTGRVNDDIVAFKTDSSGVIQWQGKLHSSDATGGTDTGSGIDVDGSGNVYVGGTTPFSGIAAGIVAKYNSSGTLQWQRTLSTQVEIRSLVVDAAGNSYVGGYANVGAQLTDFLIAKYNSSGTLQWQRICGYTGSSDYGYGVTIDGSSNVYTSGTTGSGNLLIVKYNSSGTLQWQREIASVQGRGAAADTSGNVYVVGYTSSQGAGINDMFIAKYDTSGTLQWQRLLGGVGSDLASTVQTDNSGNLYIGGRVTYNNLPCMAVVKLSDSTYVPGTFGDFTYQTASLVASTPSVPASASSLTDQAGGLTPSSTSFTPVSLPINGGDTIGIVVRTSGISSVNPAHDTIAIDGSGNIYACGYTSAQGAGGADGVIMKFNSSFDVQWQRAIGQTSSDRPHGITVDTSGNVFVAGVATLGGGSTDAFVAKYNSSGTLQWGRGFVASDVQEFYGLTTDTSGNLYLTGQFAATSSQFVTMKYDSSGTLQWQRGIGGSSGSDPSLGYSVAVSGSGNVYSCGYAYISGYQDAILVKYNSSGTLQWQRRMYGTNSSDLFNDVVLDLSENVYVVGTSYVFGDGKIILAKYNSSGTLQWQRTLGMVSESYPPYGYGITIDPGTNDIYITGSYVVAKYNSSGTLQWQKGMGVTMHGIVLDSNYMYLAQGGLQAVYRFNIDGTNLTDATYTSATGSLGAATSTLANATTTYTSSSVSLTSTTTTFTPGVYNLPLGVITTNISL